MTQRCKMMFDTLAHISLLLSFTPNTRMQIIVSLSHGSLRMVNAAESLILRSCRNNSDKQDVT